jgi:hypothetical protein
LIHGCRSNLLAKKQQTLIGIIDMLRFVVLQLDTDVVVDFLEGFVSLLKENMKVLKFILLLFILFLFQFAVVDDVFCDLNLLKD